MPKIKTSKINKIVITTAFVVLSVLLVILLVGVMKRVFNRPVNDKSIASVTFDLLKDKNIPVEKGYWYFIFYMDDFQSNHSFLKYLEHLSTERFKDEKLKLILFGTHRGDKPVSDIDPTQSRMLFYSGISGLPLPDQLPSTAIPRRCVCIIDAEGNVSFTASFIRENDVRLLLEKSFKKKTGYPGKEENNLKPGDLFGPFRIINTVTLEQLPIDKTISPRTWIIFTSNCVSCALKSNLTSYKEIESMLWGKLQMPTSLLFSPYFRIEDIDLKVKSLKIGNDVFLAADELKGIENSLYKSSDSDRNVIVVMTDSNNKITYREPFQVFLEHIKGDYFEKNKPK